WAEVGLEDIDRPLAERGERDAPAMARALVSLGFSPARILCSPALRARQTLALALPSFGNTRRIDFAHRIYEATPEDLMAVIAGAGEVSGPLMLIGHSPGLEALALALAGDDPLALLPTLRTKFPTGAAAVLDFDLASWGEITARRGRLLAFIRPADLDEGARRKAG